MKKFCLAALALMFCVSLVRADDVVAPSWRYDRGWIVATWSEFDDEEGDDWVSSKEGYNHDDDHVMGFDSNPYMPHDQNDFIVTADDGIEPGFAGQKYGDDAIEIWGDLIVSMDNFDTINTMKKFWVQITYTLLDGNNMSASGLAGEMIDLTNLIDIIVTTGDGLTTLGVFNLEDCIVYHDDGLVAEDDYYTVVLAFDVLTNPTDEIITFDFTNNPDGLVIDQLMVETLCVPEPSTAALLLLGLGGLAAIIRRRSV